MTRLIYVEIQNFDKRKYEELLSLFSEKTQKEVLKLKKWESGYIRLLSKMLLLKGMQCFNMVDFSFDLLQYTVYGRPFFNDSIDFNISHTNNCAVCIISDSLKVGVDVEEIRNIDLDDFSESFDAGEWRSLTESPAPIHTFFNYWTRKEAIIKADGRGMNIPLSTVNVQDSIASIEGNTWHLKEIKLPAANNYAIHIATNELPGDNELEIIRFTDYY